MNKLTSNYTSRALLLSAAASAALAIATPALAEPILTATAQAGPSFGLPDSQSNTGMTTQNAFASYGVFDGSGAASAVSRPDYTNRASSNVDGSGAASSSALLTETVVNNTAGTREYTFNFLINAGSVDIDTEGNTVFSTDMALASFGANVSTDTGVNWNTGVAVQLQGELFSVADDNSNDDGILNGYDEIFFLDGGIQITWDQTAFSIGLGQLAPNEEFTLEYLIDSSVDAFFGDFCFEDEFEEEIDEEFGYGGCYFTSAGISDPFGIASLGITSTAVGSPPPPPPTGVSEPESLALLGIGLAGLGLARRRRFDL